MTTTTGGHLRQRIRSATATTPGRYRAWSIASVSLLVAGALAGLFVAAFLRDTSNRLESSTGPVLVATQQAVANLAEADAASSAAFLSGDTDPESRRQYEAALARAAAHLEDVSAMIGDDVDAHTVLKELGVLVTRYVTLVESARLQINRDDSAASEAQAAAVTLLADDGTDATEQLVDATEARLDRDTESQAGLAALAVLAIGAAIVVLVVAQVDMARRSRRILNPLLAVATAAALLAGVWVTAVYLTTRSDLDAARDDGGESITLTADVQVAGQRTRAAETVAVIDDNDTGFAAAEVLASEVNPLLDQLVNHADTPRERAAALELVARWERYRVAADEVGAASGAEAVRLSIGPANSAFNGFNVSVEAVLGDNRLDFIDNLASAHDRTTWLLPIAVLIPLLAALAALAGFHQRIKEYR